MSENSNDTKQRILEVARVLFSEKGFEGTSIREIAKIADVNVAAINYHFNNKENLILEILRTGYTESAIEVRRLFEENKGDIAETLVGMFRFYVTRSATLLSHFKMLMSSQHSHHVTVQDTEDGMFGPPGGKVIAEAIIKEVGGNIPEADLMFALRTFFSHIVHNAIIYSCCLKNASHIPYSSIEDLENGIRRLTRVVIQDLKNS